MAFWVLSFSVLDLKISVPSPKEFEQDNSRTQAETLGTSNKDKSVMSLLIHDSPTSRQISSWSGVSAMNHPDRINSHCENSQSPQACPGSNGVSLLSHHSGKSSFWIYEVEWWSVTFNKHLDLGAKGLRCGTAQKELETKQCPTLVWWLWARACLRWGGGTSRHHA